jgi:hypothetical protein
MNFNWRLFSAWFLSNKKSRPAAHMAPDVGAAACFAGCLRHRPFTSMSVGELFLPARSYSHPIWTKETIQVPYGADQNNSSLLINLV